MVFTLAIRRSSEGVQAEQTITLYRLDEEFFDGL